SRAERIKVGGPKQSRPKAGSVLGKPVGTASDPEKPPASLKAEKQRDGMTAVTERAIHSEFTGTRSQNLQNLANHDRPMHPRRRLARGNHLLDVIGITLRRMLLIVFGKMPRILSAIPRSPFGFFAIPRSRYDAGG